MPVTLYPDDQIAMPNVPPRRWQDYMDALKNLVKLVDNKKKVKSYWDMPDIGTTLQFMKSSADNKKVNGVIMGINAAAATPPELQKVGGCQFDWELSIDFWIFRGYEKGSEEENIYRSMFNDCRDFGVIIYKNQLNLGINGETMLKRVGMLSFESIDLHGFPEGSALVAQGNLPIVVREQLG